MLNKEFKEVRVTDGLSQHHLVEKNLEHIINANCWAHCRRSFTDAVKAMMDRELAKQSIAYQALVRIAVIYKLDEA